MPEEDHSSSFEENEEEDYELVTASQQEVDQKISKVLESVSEASDLEEKPMRKKFKLAIKGMHHHHHFV